MMKFINNEVKKKYELFMNLFGIFYIIFGLANFNIIIILYNFNIIK